MNLNKTKAATFAAMLFATGSLEGVANAAVVINVVESGGNVIATGAGALNLNDLSPTLNRPAPPFLNPSLAALYLGSELADASTGITGPQSFGVGSFYTTGVGTGDSFGILGGTNSPDIVHPAGYISGAPLSGSITWNSENLTRLGLTEGSYQWSWGTGANFDTLTVNIGTIIPEPSSILLLGFGVFGYILRRRKSS